MDPRAGECGLCAAEPFVPFGSLSPLTRGGRTRGKIASLLLQVAFSSSASSPELQEGRGAPAGAEDWCPAGTLPAPAPQPPNTPPAAPRDGIGAGILHDNAPVKAQAHRGFGRHLRLGQKSFFSGASEHEAGGHGIWATRRTSKCKAGKSHGVRTPQNKKDKSTGVRTPSACCEFPWGPRSRTATPSAAGAQPAEQDHACCPGFKTLKPSRHPSRGFSPTLHLPFNLSLGFSPQTKHAALSRAAPSRGGGHRERVLGWVTPAPRGGGGQQLGIPLPVAFMGQGMSQLALQAPI